MIQLTFLGATNEVARSAIVVDTGLERILFDYGSNINETPPLHPNPIPGKLDAIFLSHCHLDHCGSLPLLFRNGQECPIYALDVTKKLSRVLLEDSMKIARKEGYDPGFDKKDVKTTIRSFVSIKYRQPIKLVRTKVTAFDAGHVPGSAGFLLQSENKNIFYTGDFNNSDTRLLKECDFDLPSIDTLITESTYARRNHPDRKTTEAKFVEMVNDTCANDGVAVVSGFAVGRLQELLLVLHNYKVKWPVYIDGMAKRITKIINEFPELLKHYKELKKATEKITFVNTRKRSKILKEPCVILTTSGMLNGGPVIDYIKKLHNKRNCSLFLTGYQVKGTPGRILVETGRYINSNVGLDLEMKMFVKQFDFSSHTGRDGLFKIIEKINPKKIFCIHGDNTVEFCEELKEKGYNVIAPTFPGEKFIT